MPAADFDLPHGHIVLPATPPIGFPETGLAEDEVVEDVAIRLEDNRHPLNRVAPARIGDREVETGTLRLEREGV